MELENGSDGGCKCLIRWWCTYGGRGWDWAARLLSLCSVLCTACSVLWKWCLRWQGSSISKGAWWGPSGMPSRASPNCLPAELLSCMAVWAHLCCAARWNPLSNREVYGKGGRTHWDLGKCKTEMKGWGGVEAPFLRPAVSKVGKKHHLEVCNSVWMLESYGLCCS